MIVQKTDSFVKYSCFAIASALLMYTGYRSYGLSFTHDESLSYTYMVHNSFMEIMSNRTSMVSANNHILNTLSMKFFESILGNSEWALRIQSVISHLLYLIFSFLLMKDIKNKLLILCGYI